MADRRTALKRARELFSRGDRRGASKALLEAGFSGAQIEAVFEGFLLEPAGGTRPPPKTSPLRPPPPPPARSGPITRETGAGLPAFLRKSPWRPAAVAGAAAVLAVAVLLLRPGTSGTDVVQSPFPTSTGIPTPPPADLGLSGVISTTLEGCGWSDWTGDGATDGVAATVRFADGAGRTVAVGLPDGSLFASATLAERVDRLKFNNTTGFFVVTEQRSLSPGEPSVAPRGGGWNLRVPATRTPLNPGDTARYTLEARVWTSVSPRFLGSCGF